MATVTLGTNNPTNKLTAAVIATAVVSLARAIVNAFWPDFADQSLWDAALPIAAYVAGYVVRDEANITMPTVTQTPAPVPGKL